MSTCNRAAYIRTLIINDEKFIKYIVNAMKAMPRKQKLFAKALIFNLALNLMKHYPLLNLRTNPESTDENDNATGDNEVDDRPSTSNNQKICQICKYPMNRTQKGGSITKAKARCTRRSQSGKIEIKTTEDDCKMVE